MEVIGEETTRSRGASKEITINDELVFTVSARAFSAGEPYESPVTFCILSLSGIIVSIVPRHEERVSEKASCLRTFVSASLADVFPSQAGLSRIYANVSNYLSNALNGGSNGTNVQSLAQRARRPIVFADNE